MIKLLEDIFKKRLSRFALVGAVATLAHISFAFISIGLFNHSVFLANLLGFSFAFALSYLLQSHFVFKKKTSCRNATRFFLVQFTGLITAQIMSQMLSSHSPYYRVLFVVFFIPLMTYLIHHIWTYNENNS